MTKVCPDCAETVQDDARVCRYCGFRFAPPIEAEAKGAGTPDPERHPQREESPSPTPEPDRRRSGRRVFLWLIPLAIIVGVAIAVAIILNGQNHPRLGDVNDNVLKPSLPVGGLASHDLPLAIAEESLQQVESVGYQLVLAALEEHVITEFRYVDPEAPWISEFKLDGEPLFIRFAKKNENYEVEYPPDQESKVDKLFAIGSRFGFTTASDEALKQHEALFKESNALATMINETEFTEEEEDLAIVSQASELVMEWEQWLEKFEGEDSGLDHIAGAEINMTRSAEAFAEDPTEFSQGEYNEAIDALNRLLDEKEQEVERSTAG